MIKNKLIITLVLLALICSDGVNGSVIYAEDLQIKETVEIVDDTEKTSISENNTTVTEPLKQDENIIQKNNFKKPISKKKILKKFLLAMFGVAVSAFLIYFVLTLYNKIRYRLVNNVRTPEGEAPLKTPDNTNEAVQIFLKKTQWK